MAKRTFFRACLLMALTSGTLSVAVAAGLQVSPTTLSLPNKQRAGVFTLSNTGDKAMTAQVRVYRWTQDSDGNDVLTPSGDVVASPPMVKLAVGGTQQFRVIRTKPASAHEETFRLIVDELPAADETPSAGLQFVLRYSIPLFLNRGDAADTQLQWRVSQTAEGKTQLSVKNIGTHTAQLSSMKLADVNLAGGLAGYVLAGNTWTATFDVPPSAFKDGKLSVTINGQQVTPEVQGAAH